MLLKTLKRINAKALAGPFRPTDWRHREATSLVLERRMPSPRLHDEITTRLANAYQRLCGGRTHLDRLRLKQVDKDAYAAIKLRFDAPTAVRCVVEALILADEEAKEIGRRVGLTPEAVCFYEEAYCEIRSRLRHHDFVLHGAIRLGEAKGDAERLVNSAVKMFGYLGGTRAIDVLTAAPKPSTQRRGVSDILSLLAKRARALLQFDVLSRKMAADPRLAKNVAEVVDSIEKCSVRYGDESIPKTKMESLEAELFALVHGEPNHRGEEV